MNHHKLKQIIEMKFMGGGDNTEVRRHLTELIDRDTPMAIDKPFEIANVKSCQKCNTIINDCPNFCSYCGQKLL